MKIKQMMLLIFILILLTLHCDLTDLPVNTSFVLILEDVSCTEAWIKVNGETGSEIILNRDDAEVMRFTLTGNEMIVVDDSLQPNKTYNYKAIRNGEVSNQLNVTTLDTTSHNFTRQTFTFGGDAGSSVLYDVAIINENNIWAVGEINITDTSINGYTTYNAVHWNGIEWELKKIPVRDFGELVGIFPLRTVYAFSQDNTWFASYADLIKWDGEIFQSKAFFMISAPFNGQVNKIWGNSENNLYCIGNSGAIYLYNGQTWEKIESGTDVRLGDIYGTPDGKTVWISGYEDFKPTVLLKISDSKVETVFSSQDYLSVFSPDHISGEITSIWTNSNNSVYITTPYSLYRKSIHMEPSIEEALRFGSPLSWLGRRSRGNDINNIFIAGGRGNVHHYNGITFKTYQELADNSITYYSLDVRGKLAVLCGQKFENGISDKAIITIIK